MDEQHHDQPGAPGVDPAVADAPPIPDEASPSTVPTGNEPEAAPTRDPGQHPDLRSPAAAPAAAVVSPSAAAGEGYSSSRPLLMIGAAGAEVAELGYLLAAHGFENAVSKGEAAAPPILDDALMRTVVEFQQANDVDPWKTTGSDNPNEAPILRAGHLGVVDARTWEALLGYQPKQAAPGSELAAEVKPQ
jgi:hypothetical protein